jgi:hypothetical protein
MPRRTKRKEDDLPGQKRPPLLGLPSSSVLELVAHVVEEELALEHSNVRAQWNVELPERITGTRRQVDVAVTYDVGDREMIRIVEVQDRTRKVGSPFVDQVEGKREVLGAARATLVSTAGFTGPALSRIASKKAHLDGVLLRLADSPEWPERFQIREMRFEVQSRPITVPLVGRIYEDALTEVSRLFVAYGAAREPDVVGAFMFVFRSDGQKLAGNRPFAPYSWLALRLPGGTSVRLDPEFEVAGTRPDGTPFRQALPLGP